MEDVRRLYQETYTICIARSKDATFFKLPPVEQGQAREGRAHTALYLYIDHYLYGGHRWMQQRLAWHLYGIKVFDTYSHYTTYTYYTCYSA